MDHPEMVSTNAYLENNTNTIFHAPTLEVGSHFATIRSLDSDLRSSSSEVTLTFSIHPSPFETIIPNVTQVKASQMQALRIAVNNIRKFHHMAPVIWSDGIFAGRTAVNIWQFHIMEIRTALEPVMEMINDFDASTIFDIPHITWLAMGSGRPKADVMQQLQDLITTL